MSGVKEKVIVVTGAAGAIGRTTAAALADKGAVVVGVDVQTGQDVAADWFAQCDLTDEREVASLYAAVASRYGRIDGLFNNAGVVLPGDGSVLEVGLDAFTRTLAINVASVFLCCKHGIPHLVRNGGGTVVNTASLVASMGSAASQIAYTASKGAVLAMTRELAVEFARRGVRANALSPGPVQSPLLDSVFTGDEVARRMVHVPAGRFALAEEVAAAACYLLGEESSYVTGIELRVDGGITAAYVTPEGGRPLPVLGGAG
ncbi:SDR family oxidoreductase [Dactylosporangium sp. CA-233914]|uniref:SDR family oxidoreductase n=1 Tax=Dactylosporangium sp. CA-233914 TaxID=3239934 RepID=UPI003D8C088A